MHKKYSILIHPLSILAHLLILNAVFIIWGDNYLQQASFIIYLNISWLLIAYFIKLYHFSRTIKITKVVSQLFTQYIVFTLSIFTFFSLTDTIISTKHIGKLLIWVFIGVLFFRALYFYALRKYRVEGKNFKKVVVIGSNGGLKPLIEFMMNRPDFGYRIMGLFSDNHKPSLNYTITNKALINNGNGKIKHLGKINDCYNYIVENDVDEIYCSISEVSKEYIETIIDFADKNLIVLKLVPDHQDTFVKNTHLEYYGLVPVLAWRSFPLDNPISQFLKRVFDILFSLIVIIFVLSWLTPLLAFFIKRESKGPVFFKQVREGFKGDSFMCYKYRSMGVNDRSEEDQTIKGDVRITKIGKIIRKTSIDELPQFLNVLKGDMSVVGPRPHMLSQSEIFKGVVKEYMVRHFVKPGITGLAQVKGYRGEIESDKDIINRVKLDIFYIENWSFVLDINIIIRTVLNVFQGEDKAY